jgi:acetylornithine deacetylase
MNTIQIKPGRLKQLFKEMVDIYSPSGKEGQIISFLEDYLSQFGLKPVLQQVEEGRSNLLILPENNISHLVFIGHVDTINAYNYENFQSAEEGTEICGLGTADMKGGCAAMIEAFLSFREHCNQDFPAALALVVGEEESGDGTNALLEEYHYSWAIVGEPTNMIPCLSHYGYLEMELNTRGKQMHASLAKEEHNAIQKMLRMLLKLTDYLDSEKKDVIYNIRDVNSSQAGFVVPDRCEAWVDLHVPPAYPIGTIAIELEELIRKFVQKENRYLEEIMSFSMIHAGYDLPDQGTLPGFLKEVYRKHEMEWKPGSFQSDSDASLLWSGGVKPLILGPGQLARAHTQDESVSFPQVLKASQIYLDLLNLYAEDQK